MKKLQFILILFISFCGFSQNETLFEQGNKAYNEGAYEVAAKNYLQIVDGGEHSAELYYNLGNVYYKLNEIAPSIYYYEKALLLNPGDADIKNNLAYAKNMTLDAIEVMPETGLAKIYNSATSYFSFEQWAYVSVALMLLFVFCYLLYYFLRYATYKRIAFVSGIVFLFLAFATITITYSKYNIFSSDQPAIVFDKEVVVKSEPNDTSAETFRLHEGTKVLILDELGEWKKIKIADGKTGWLDNKSIKILKDF